MGTKERKARERKNRGEAIIKAAKKIIVKQGVEAMSLNQVADRTELNKATLYLYFSNKDDLIDAIVYEGLVMLEKKLQESDPPSASGLEKVLALIKTTFDFYRQYPVYFYTMNHQERRKPHERQNTPHAIKGDEITARLFDRYNESLRLGLEEGSIRREIDIRQVFVLIYAHTYGIMHTIYAKEDIYKDVLHLEPVSIEKSALEFMEYYLR